jgi:hypothetical protein
VNDGGNLPTGLPIQLVNATGQLVAATTTNNGAYAFSNVATGSYYVRTNAPAGGIPFINQLYNNVNCLNNCSIFTTVGSTPVNVSNGVTTSGINFALQRGGVITGTTTMTVAEDGKSYTATASRKRPDGIQYNSTIVWRRVGSR